MSFIVKQFYFKLKKRKKMKFLPLFLLFMTANIFAQTIDCQELEKIRTAQGKKRTTRTFSAMSTDFSDMETTSEIDTLGRVRTMTKSVYKKGSMAGKTELRESLLIDRIHYSKSPSSEIWEYLEMPKIDTAQHKKFANIKPKYENCHKVGTETIDGKHYDIIESTMHMNTTTGLASGLDSTVAMQIRIWVNFQDSSIKKLEGITQTPKGQALKVITEYSVDIKPIEKPQNAVPKKDKVAPPPVFNKAGIDPNLTNPEFKEGQRALFGFINTNLVYPQAARDAKKEGTVYVGFFVETDGTVTNINVKRGIDKECDEAAIELIKKTSGNWKPALSSGKPVRSPYTLPIKFKL
jgi:TonB family protein